VATLAIGLVIGKGNWHPFGEPREKIPQEILADTNQLEFFRSMDMIETLSSLESPDGTKVQPGDDYHSYRGRLDTGDHERAGRLGAARRPEC
jgi:hypothetical protein